MDSTPQNKAEQPASFALSRFSLLAKKSAVTSADQSSTRPSERRERSIESRASKARESLPKKLLSRKKMCLRPHARMASRTRWSGRLW
jgi:hypothetical protein